MTTQWCAYCQQFMGESAPFENFEMSHGMCGSCSAQGLEVSEKTLARARELKAFQAKLMAAGRGEASPSLVSALVDEALAMRVRPIDLLMGLVTPLLCQIGEQWEKGEVTVYEEHRFTAFCERILETIEKKTDLSNPKHGQGGLKVLMINAPGSQHCLGVRAAALFLSSSGLRSRSIYPGFPPQEIGAVLNEFNPEFLGISISLAEQVPAVLDLIEIVRSDKSILHPPQVICGGFAVRSGKVPPIPGVTLVSELMSVLSLVSTAGVAS